MTPKNRTSFMNVPIDQRIFWIYLREKQGSRKFLLYNSNLRSKGNLKRKFSWNTIAQKENEIFWRFSALASKMGQIKNLCDLLSS